MQSGAGTPGEVDGVGGDLYVVGDTELDGIVYVNPDTLTSGGTDDFSLEVLQTLNDAGAAGGSDKFTLIKGNMVVTDDTGWDELFYFDLQRGGTSLFAINDLGDMEMTPVADDTGSPNHLKITGAAHTTLTASTQASDVVFDLARTVEFAAGALTLQAAFTIEAPTYAFVGASSLTVALTMGIFGIPEPGANATISVGAAFAVGNAAGYTSDITGIGTAGLVVIPGIGSGITTVSRRSGLSVGGDASGNVSLGNQTATLTTLNSINLGQVTYNSTTLTRTVTTPSTLYVEGPPVAGTNMAFTNGPYAILVASGLSSFTGPMEISAGAAFTASSGTETILDISPTVNQSGSAGYQVINIDITETATGSGEKQYLTMGADGFLNFEFTNNGRFSVFSVNGEAARGTASTTTADGTVTTLATLDTDSDTAIHVTATVVGHETADSNETASYVIHGTFQNDGGVLTQIGATTSSHAAEVTAAWGAGFDVNSTNIRVRVTGAAATNIQWVASYHALIAETGV